MRLIQTWPHQLQLHLGTWAFSIMVLAILTWWRLLVMGEIVLA